MADEKILIYGEGPTDYGWKEYGQEEWQAGPATILVQKCAEQAYKSPEIGYVEKKVIDGKGRPKLAQRQLKGLKGKAIPARYFRQYAISQGYSRGIFYCDTDKIAEGSNTDEAACRKEFQRIYKEVASGLQDDSPEYWKAVPMVALKMIESWLLADPRAFEKLFGKWPTNPRLPAKPELIWGDKEEPQSDFPKNYLKRVLNQYHAESCKEIFVQLAEQMDIEKLEEACPISFAKFSDDLKNALG